MDLGISFTTDRSFSEEFLDGWIKQQDVLDIESRVDVVNTWDGSDHYKITVYPQMFSLIYVGINEDLKAHFEECVDNFNNGDDNA